MSAKASVPVWVGITHEAVKAITCCIDVPPPSVKCEVPRAPSRGRAAKNHECWPVQQISVANVENRLLVSGLLAAQEYLHFVALMSTGEGSSDGTFPWWG